MPLEMGQHRLLIFSIVVPIPAQNLWLAPSYKTGHSNDVHNVMDVMSLIPLLRGLLLAITRSLCSSAKSMSWTARYQPLLIGLQFELLPKLMG